VNTGIVFFFFLLENIMNMKRLHHYILVVVTTCLSSLTAAQPFVVASTDPNVILTPIFTNISGDLWDLHVKVEHSESTVPVDIIVNRTSAGLRPSLRNLTFDLIATSTSYLAVTLSVHGLVDEGQADNLASLGSLQFEPSFDPYAPTVDREIIIDSLIVFGDVGYIECNAINEARIGGDLIDGLALYERNGFNNKPRIDDMLISGDLLSDIVFFTSRPEVNKFVITGDVGTPAAPVAVFVGLYGRVGNFECNNFYGGFRAEQGLRRFVANGSFVGTFYAANIYASNLGEGSPGIFVGEFDGSLSAMGSFTADIVINGDFPSGSVMYFNPAIPESSSIVFHGELAGQIFLDAGNGLEGQIIVNADNAPDPNHSLWSGQVSVWDQGAGQPILLSPNEVQPGTAPFYGEPSVNLGGGAVGLVPFNFHSVDSNPDHDTVVTAVPSSVQIHHYGPVSIGSGTGVKVHEGSITIPFGFSSVGEVYLCYTGPLNDFWTDVTDSFNITTNGRVVTVANGTGKFKKNRSYQIIPDGLVCDDVPGNPPVVYTSNWVGTDMGTEYCAGLPETNGYGFIVPSGFDLNMNLTFDTGDIETWIANPVDLDSDTDADTLDLILLVDVVATGVGE
jgi:hypothetical protein